MFLAMLLAMSCSSPILDARDGWGGQKWGSTMPQGVTCEPSVGEADTQFCINPNESNLKADGKTLKSIGYFYRKNKLSEIQVTFYQEDYEFFLGKLVERHGQGAITGEPPYVITKWEDGPVTIQLFPWRNGVSFASEH